MIQCEVSGNLWRVTINRPEKAGALTRDMLIELAEIAERATAAKVVVFGGTGTVFSAGADLDQARAGLAVDPVWQRLSHAVAALPGLTIAALNGTAAGGAMGLVLACDLRIAVPQAKFFYPVMKLGYLPQASDPGRLTALVGPSRAKMILMAGQKILAEEALQWGLIDRIVPLDDLSAQVDQLTQDVMHADPRHVAAIKSMIPTT
ncbi:enoyl-CoA hydratase/isomerase family protein [Yoonia sp. I 8.24]|uniref:enoyl-CoA hydratase/isomerase family protein n=1 Tax=Yoonia sp. I 8.24 TaxID=1537229 RepID=UPI001EDE5669|nr:enoyl-CoA hydratase/isomerase family protein [Yoonia sp. I 8.24]MCG3268582.1 enoyl-CoA hydratase/isomerase family protein [Yoonia sp. I 8.24]